MSILIKNVALGGEPTDVFIAKNYIDKIEKNIGINADIYIDGSEKALIPGFINGHNHAAMTLFRGFGDDIALEKWLAEKIWPNEAKMTEEDVYWGTKLACLEMIKSGTTCFNDMYWHPFGTSAAVKEMGIRSIVSGVIFDHFDNEAAELSKTKINDLFENQQNYGNRVKFALGPHAIYTVSKSLLKWVHEFSFANDILIHLHIAETQTECENSVKNFGLSPVKYLNKIGLLSPNLVLAHCLWVDNEEIKMLADNNVKIIHNPNSNMKLASGINFKYCEMRDAGITVGIGTDGCASSNNLDMVEAMKSASLISKGWRLDPIAMTAEEAFNCATKNGAEIFKINSGEIKVGNLADLCLVNMNIPAFTPNFNFISNLVYAANGSCIDTVICDGKILMQNHYVEGETEIMRKAAQISYSLIERQV